jgi:hypothetical protein
VNDDPIAGSAIRPMEVEAMEKNAPVLPDIAVSEIYRETFLFLLPPEEAAAVRVYGATVEDRLLDRPAGEMPRTSYTEAEMQGVLADLLFLAGFLRSVSREREASELAERDWLLASFAAELAGEVAVLAARLDREFARLANREVGSR